MTWDRENKRKKEPQILPLTVLSSWHFLKTYKIWNRSDVFLIPIHKNLHSCGPANWKKKCVPSSSKISTQFARKMRKNFVGVIVVILVGIVICFALANLVLMANQHLKSDGISDTRGRHASVISTDGSDGFSGQKSVNFRSLKGNRRSSERNIYTSSQK